MATTDKVRENRVRRVASRRGFRLIKSRRRDPLAINYGKYWLIDAKVGSPNHPADAGMSLDEVEAALTSAPQ